jgi:hypothetical protein
LTVDYRALTPVQVPLAVEASVDGQEGRKLWVSGRLLRDRTLLAQASGLFIRARPEGSPRPE